MNQTPSYPLPLEPMAETPGSFRCRAQCVVCKNVDTHYTRQIVDGDGNSFMSPDVVVLIRGLGWFDLHDVGLVCGETCARRSKSEANKFSVDASRFPDDPRLNQGSMGLAVSATGPITTRCAFGGCTSVHVCHNHPNIARELQNLGWQRHEGRPFCGKLCAHKAGFAPAQAAKSAVASTRPMPAREAPDLVESGPVNPLLVSKDAPATKARRR